MKRGLFITFEGIDGCGKSTQISLLARHLEQEGIVPLLTREPGGTPVSEAIREILISPDNAGMTQIAELLLYLAARAQHMEEKIVPALRAGRLVLCDRFEIATFAYQGFGRGFSVEELKRLNRFATGGISADLTLIFDISVESSRNRLAAMNKVKDRLESDSVHFYEKIREGYRALASEDEKILLLDGEKGIEELSLEVYAQIKRLMTPYTSNNGINIAT